MMKFPSTSRMASASAETSGSSSGTSISIGLRSSSPATSAARWMSDRKSTGRQVELPVTVLHVLQRHRTVDERAQASSFPQQDSRVQMERVIRQVSGIDELSAAHEARDGVAKLVASERNQVVDWVRLRFGGRGCGGRDWRPPRESSRSSAAGESGWNGSWPRAHWSVTSRQHDHRDVVDGHGGGVLIRAL